MSENDRKFVQLLYLSSCYVVGVLLLAGGRVEDDVVDCLHELELHNALDQQTLEDLVLHVGRHTRAWDLSFDVVIVQTGHAVYAACAAVPAGRRSLLLLLTTIHVERVLKRNSKYIDHWFAEGQSELFAPQASDCSTRTRCSCGPGPVAMSTALNGKQESLSNGSLNLSSKKQTEELTCAELCA